MALVNQDLVLDVVPGPIPPILHLTEYDENMEVVVTLQRCGQPFQIPTGTTVKIDGTLKGHPFSENATPSGNTVTFTVSKNMTAYSGRAWTKIKLTNGGKPVSTCGFWLDCDRAGVEADTVIGTPGFEEQIAEAVQDVLTETEALALVTGSASEADALAEGLIPLPILWENGNIDDNGQDSDYDAGKRLRTVGYIPIGAVTHARNCAAVVSSKLFVMYYDAQKVYQTYMDLGATETQKDYALDQNYAFARFTMITYTDAGHETKADEVPADAYANVVFYRENEAFVRRELYAADVEALRRGYLPCGIMPIYEQGNIGYDGADNDTSKAKRVRTKGYLPTSAVKNVIVKSGYIRVYVECYNSESVAGYQKYYFADNGAVVDESYPYVRFIFIRYPDAAHSSQDNISPEDIASAVILAGTKNQVEETMQSMDGFRAQIGEVNSRLWALEGGSVPTVYEEHIAQKIQDINDLADDMVTGEQFIFATDYHGVPYKNEYHNNHQMKSLINSIVRGTSISLTINGGDVLNSDQGAMTRATFLRYMRKFCQYWSGDDYTTTLFVAGNHDLGCDGSGSGVTPPVISEHDLYVNSGLAAIADELTTDEHTPFNYFYDSEGGKIRYIVLLTNNMSAWGFSNTGYAESFLINALDTMPDDWTAVVVYHWPFGDSGNPVAVTNRLAAIMSAYNARQKDDENDQYDFSNAAGVAPIIIGGHQHLDRDKTLVPIDGYPIIVAMTTTACWDGEYGTIDRSEGTVNEEAFDVFTIDTGARKITATRIGGGQSREWTY